MAYALNKIGKEVLFLKTSKENLRNGEGSFVRLKNGDILHIYTAYLGESSGDNGSARLCGVKSSDEGENWSCPFVVLELPEGAKNVMSVSLLRMQNGDVGLFYLEKYFRRSDSAIVSRYMLMRSSDDGVTWRAPVACIDDGGYYVVNNDRVIRLINGDIVIPAAYHGSNKNTEIMCFEKGRACYFLSNDDGKSFYKMPSELTSPYIELSNGLQEPGIYQFKDGRVWSWFRTNLGFQFEAFSDDGCKSFSEVSPNLFFASPNSPLQVKKIGKYTIAVFNPIPHNATTPKNVRLARSPLVLSVSEDDGKTFIRSYLLEDDPNNAYSYPSIIEGDNYFLVAYYHSNGKWTDLNCTKIVKVSFEEIETSDSDN